MTRPNVLGLHVIGEGIGECVILELPNVAPAIIDCGNSEVADYAINFVKEELGWDRLSFVAVTHPHLDHFEGLGLILDAFSKKCGALWVFPGFFQGDALNRYLRWIELVNPQSDFDPIFFSNTVRREWMHFAEFAIRHKMLPRVMRSDEPCLQGEVEIRCILPCGEVADGFDRDLSLCAPSKNWLEKFPHGSPLKLPAPPRANSASSVISVVWGRTKLLLCGDCEIHSWEAWEKIGANLSGDIHGLKIGHHGSINGAYSGLLNCLNKKTHAIVTPFRRGKKPLPEAKVIEAYQSRCGFLCLTASVAPPSPDGWNQDSAAMLHALKVAIDDPSGAAPKLLKLHAKTQLHENVVGILFDNDGNAIEQYCGKGTERFTM